MALPCVTKIALAVPEQQMSHRYAPAGSQIRPAGHSNGSGVSACVWWARCNPAQKGCSALRTLPPFQQHSGHAPACCHPPGRSPGHSHSCTKEDKNERSISRGRGKQARACRSAALCCRMQPQRRLPISHLPLPAELTRRHHTCSMGREAHGLTQELTCQESRMAPGQQHPHPGMHS